MCDIVRRLNSPVTKQQYLSYLNDFSRTCRNKKSEELFLIDNEDQNPIFLLNRNSEKDNYTMDDVLTCLKTALFYEAVEVRAAALRAIRYLLKDETTVKSLLRINLPIYIVRSIDIVLENRIERIQALRLVRKFLSISPKLFPAAFTRSLVAIAQDGLDEHDSLTRACWALLAELSIMCPKSSTRDTQNNAFNAIMDATLSGKEPHGICESLISTLLFMLNWPSYRCLIRGKPDLQIFIAPFTDSHYSAPVVKNQKQGINQSAKFDVDPYDQRELKFNAAKITLISILRSWPGLIYLCEPQDYEANLVTKSCLKSLINMLYLPYNDVRKRLLELLFELLYLPLPDSSADFDSGLRILEKHQLSKDSWKIHDAFIVDEARALLTPMRSRVRMNLLNDYMALLLLALFQCNVVDALSEVIITPASQENSNRATILLYQLLSLSYQYLPTDSFSQYLTLSTLIAHATSKKDDSRDLANAALINLGRIKPPRRPLQHIKNTKYSLFLAQLLQFCSPHLLAETIPMGQEDMVDSCESHNNNDVTDNCDSSSHRYDNSSVSASCNSMSNTSTINSLSTILSNHSNLTGQRSDSSSTSSTSTLVNAKRKHSRSPSISSRSPSILSKASTLTTATSLFNIFSLPSASKSTLKTMVEQNWESWDLEHINYILTRPCDSLKKLSNHHYKTFIKRLVQFYKPSSNQYSIIDVNHECNRQLCDTGCKLIDFLIDNPEVKATELLIELLHDISISMHDPENTYNNHDMNSSTRNTTNSSPKQTNNNYRASIHHQHISSTPNNDKGTSANHQMMYYQSHSATLPLTGSGFQQNQQSEVNILSSSKLISTMSSTYFLFIGRLTSSIRGYKLLEKTSIIRRISNLTQSSMPSSSPAEVYVRLIISCFDYTKEYNGSRKLLEKFLFEHQEESVRLYATNFLRVLLRANVQDYSTWAMEMLVKQLCSSLRVIQLAAADILDEACDFDAHLEGLIGLKKVMNPETKTETSVLNILRSSKDVGYILLCRYASSPNGLRYLIETPRQCLSMPLDTMLSSKELPKTTSSTSDQEEIECEKQAPSSSTNDVAQPTANIQISSNPKSIQVRLENEFDVEITRWQTHFNYRYVKLVEDVLNDSLTYHQKGEDGKYGRRIDRINPTTKNSFIPPHLYGQLAQHTEGIEILRARHLMDPILSILKNPPDDVNYSEVALLKLKAALWIIGHVGSSSLGYQMFENSREVLAIITEIAKDGLVLSLRGTAFYVIALLGSTTEGAEELREFGWIVQNNDVIALPVSLDLILTKPKDDIGDDDHPIIVFDPTIEQELYNNSETEFSPVQPHQRASPSSPSPNKEASNTEKSAVTKNNLQHKNKQQHLEEKQQHQQNRLPNVISDDEVKTSGADGTTSSLSETASPAKCSESYQNSQSTSTLSIPTDLDHQHLHQPHCHHHPSSQKFLELQQKYSQEELLQIRRDIMKQVSNLCASLGYQRAENSLLEYKRKYADLFKYDISLYSQVCQQMARFNFRLQARRFLQELFLETVG